jgi:thymidylate synthase
VPFRWVAEELFWFLSGSSDEKDLRARGVDIGRNGPLNSDGVRSEKNLDVYGYLWRSLAELSKMNGAPDRRLIHEMTNPNSRRLIVTGWNPETCDNAAATLPHAVSVQGGEWKDPPLPALSAIGGCFSRRAVQYQQLCVVDPPCHVTGLKPGEFIHTFGDLHIYLNHLEQVNGLLAREPMELPILELVNADSLKGYKVCLISNLKI